MGNIPCYTLQRGANGLECLIYPILNCGLHVDEVISTGIFTSRKWINPGSENGYKNQIVFHLLWLLFDCLICCAVDEK
jgi:hypothetical protein